MQIDEEPLCSEVVIHEYHRAVGLAFGHPDSFGLEMSDPSYESLGYDAKTCFEIYKNDVAILVDGYTAQEDERCLFCFALGITCNDCGWTKLQCCCGRYKHGMFNDTNYRVDLLELANQKVHAALAEALARQRVRRRTARLRWAFLRRVVRARSVVVYWMDEAARRPARLRWAVLRRGVRARGVVVYWMGEAAKRTCAPGGRGREADAVAFASEFV